MLRDYQQRCHDAAIEWVSNTVDPCVIEAATGAGKSHIIAAIAATIHKVSGGKHILCLAPSAELVTQNREKYLATGEPASMFSAATGQKSLRHPVVFGTPGTVKNNIHRFSNNFCAVIIDEAHGLTPTIRHIIERMRESVPTLRVIGLSATPYRLGEGYIYRQDENGRPMDAIKDPFFVQRVACVPAHELIEQGYLTAPTVGAVGDHYDTSHMELNSRGKWDSGDVDKAFHGHGRKTAAIVSEVVRHAKNRKGVMFFAATVQHAEEILASLPPQLSGIVTGASKDRKETIRRFKAQQIKYLVNVSVLTTGFDAPHVDVIAILRKTESAALLQQILGRGMRVSEGKGDFLVLDYAENIDYHFPDGDLFTPDIRVTHGGEGSGKINTECPSCGFVNEFAARPNPDEYQISKDGYFLDLDGNSIGIPAHFGRKCQGLMLNRQTFQHDECQHRWAGKTCPECGHENDIAARYCKDCKAELVDPNEKLKMDFAKMKRDPYQMQRDRLVDWSVKETMSMKGNPTIRVDYTTEYRKFSTWLAYTSKAKEAQRAYQLWAMATDKGEKMPDTITYMKDRASGFFRVLNYNEVADEIPQ